jgi:hypothetical protein
MPRKKKEQAPRPEGYDILIGFVNKFKYSDEEEDMNGHPAIGKCYRLIKDHRGFRIHIGRENLKRPMDGLYLSDIVPVDNTIKGKTPYFTFEITLVTPENYLDLEIDKDDLKKVAKWLSTDNEDMWDQLRKEADNTSTVITGLADLLKLREKMEDEARKIEESPATVSFSPVRDSNGAPHPDDVRGARILSHSISLISEKEPDALGALVDYLEYMATTYDDKYESRELPNVSKAVLIESAIAAPINMWQVMKYAQRYMTTGYEKSYNTKDLYKIIHYTLFEIQRRKYQDLQNG